MERHYIFKLVDGIWVQCTGWYPAKEDCEYSLECIQELEPEALYTMMTQSGELV